MTALRAREPAIKHEDIVRIDVQRDGRLVLTVEDGTVQRWFHCGGTSVNEVDPGGDEQLSLTQELKESQAPFQLLSYRPGKRLVVRDDAGQGVVRKGFRKGRSKSAHLRHAHVATSTRGNGFVFPELTEHRLSSDSLVFAAIDGEPLRFDGSSADLFFLVGAHLRLFQKMPIDPSLPVFEAKDELAVLDSWRGRYEMALGELPGGWRDLRQELGQLTTRIAVCDGVLAHRDLHDGQFLEVGGRVALLDLDLLAIADPALDPANLLAHLSLREMQGTRGASSKRVLESGEALLEGLGRGEQPSFWSRLRYYQGTTFLRLALVYGLRPRWQHLVPELLVLAERCTAQMRRELR